MDKRESWLVVGPSWLSSKDINWVPFRKQSAIRGLGSVGYSSGATAPLQKFHPLHWTAEFPDRIPGSPKTDSHLVSPNGTWIASTLNTWRERLKRQRMASVLIVVFVALDENCDDGPLDSFFGLELSWLDGVVSSVLAERSRTFPQDENCSCSLSVRSRYGASLSSSSKFENCERSIESFSWGTQGGKISPLRNFLKLIGSNQAWSITSNWPLLALLPRRLEGSKTISWSIRLVNTFGKLSGHLQSPFKIASNSSRSVAPSQ